MTDSARKAELQLRLVRAIVRAEQRRGRTDGLAPRAAAIVEGMAPSIEASGDAALKDLLADVREAIAVVERATRA